MKRFDKSEKAQLKERGSTIFYSSWLEVIEELDLPEEEQLQIIKALINYGCKLEEPKLSGAGKIIFDMAKPNIHASQVNWLNGQKGKKHGIKGGRPPKKDSTNNPENNPEITPKKTGNVYVSDTDKVSDTYTSTSQGALSEGAPESAKSIFSEEMKRFSTAFDDK